MIFLNREQSNGEIDMTSTMYPSSLHKLAGSGIEFATPSHSTVFGVVLDGKVVLDRGTKTALPLEYFCLTGAGSQVVVFGCAILFVRHGFRGQPMVGGPVEESGRLTYIDNCSDTLLVYPPRFGDPSMSLLSFPKNIRQRFHIHPSVRLGVIIRGQGLAETEDGVFHLTPGVAFCVREKEPHRFVTEAQGLDAISFHPEGDWGPTDENHALLNRTYLGKFMKE